MARRIADLDPRDFDARTAVRTQLRERRQRLGLTQKALGDRLGWPAGNLRRMERRGVDQSHATTVMWWARGTGLRLALQPVGFPPPARVRLSSGVDLLAALGDDVQMDGAAGDAWQAMRLMQHLVRIRVACGVTQQQMANRFGTTLQAVSLLEQSHNSPALVVLQRHARAIAQASRRRDAYLRVHLEDAESCSADTGQLLRSNGEGC